MINYLAAGLTEVQADSIRKSPIVIIEEVKMNSSQLNELATALAKAQGEIEAASKNTVNPHFKSSYADLASVWDACREPLSKNGLSVVQTVLEKEKGLSLMTKLCHASGQFISGEMPLILTKQDMQGLGSAITYARRFSLAAICGIAQADDDGESAISGHQHKGLEYPKAPAGNLQAGKPGEAAPNCFKCAKPMMTSKYNNAEWYCWACKVKMPKPTPIQLEQTAEPEKW